MTVKGHKTGRGPMWGSAGRGRQHPSRLGRLASRANITRVSGTKSFTGAMKRSGKNAGRMRARTAGSWAKQGRTGVSKSH